MGDNLPSVDLGSGRSAKFIAAGESHTCAILDDGSAKCWGYGANGRLGYGDTLSRGDGAGEMGDYLPVVDLGRFKFAEPWPFVPYPCAQMKSYGFNVDYDRCSARDYRSHCERPMDVKTNAADWPSDLPPPVNLNSCARDLYRTGGRVVFSLVDDNSVKDLPSSAAEIAAGFQNSNAFYIGNAELEAINIKSAKMCLERSKARGDSECNTNCLDIVDSHWSSCDAHAIFSSGTKNVIMAMTGQLAMGSCSNFYDGQTGCDSTTGDYCWSCGRNGKVGQAINIQNNWHAHNYGMNLWRDGGTDELYHYYTVSNGECAMVYENGETYWDSFYIVVQE